MYWKSPLPFREKISFSYASGAPGRSAEKVAMSASTAHPYLKTLLSGKPRE